MNIKKKISQLLANKSQFKLNMVRNVSKYFVKFNK